MVNSNLFVQKIDPSQMMRRKFYVYTIHLLLPLLLWRCSAAFQKQVREHRQHYKAEFLNSPRSPLDSADLAFLRFYDPDPAYRVTATLERISNAQPFEMATYAGTTKPYILFAKATFQLKGATHQLAIYRSLELSRMPQFRDYLFLPFKDATNGDTTYGGGRYMDFRVGDIKDDSTLVIDFNKAYNPYCAYSDGYQCPIPPPENQLGIAVEAGEMEFGKSEIGSRKSEREYR